MTSVRLLPVVIVAAFALLVLKGVGLVTEGAYMLVGTQTAQAQQATPELDDGDLLAADRASDVLFSRAEPAPISSSQLDAVPVTENTVGDKIAIGSTDGIAETERAVLERLGERRTELDILAGDLDTRMALVEAAERRLAERIANLEAIEARISALVDERKAIDDTQFANLIGMYENMKPADAAAIFDELAVDVLVRVARGMSPRKLSPVMAKMTRARAQELTLRLAAVEPEPMLDAPIDELANLPQIVGQ